MENILASIFNDSVITCDEIIDIEAKSNNEETKSVPTNFNEKSRLSNKKILYFAYIFMNYYSVINIC